MAKRKHRASAIDFTQIVQEVVNEYGQDVKADAQKICAQIAPEIVNRLKTTSPRSNIAHNHYADSWTYTMNTDRYGTIKVTVYNEKHYQLTHLLENGHEIIAHGKHIGRYKGVKHIKPAQDWAVEEITKELEKKL